VEFLIKKWDHIMSIILSNGGKIILSPNHSVKNNSCSGSLRSTGSDLIIMSSLKHLFWKYDLSTTEI
jgi:hypothetical protein